MGGWTSFWALTITFVSASVLQATDPQTKRDQFRQQLRTFFANENLNGLRDPEQSLESVATLSGPQSPFESSERPTLIPSVVSSASLKSGPASDGSSQNDDIFGQRSRRRAPFLLSPDFYIAYPELVSSSILQSLNLAEKNTVESNPKLIEEPSILDRKFDRPRDVKPPVYYLTTQMEPITSGSGIYFAPDVQYFPTPAEGAILLAANQAELKASKKSMVEKPPAELPPTAVTTPAPTAAASPAAPLSKQRRQRRAKWSAALQTPANLTVDADATITLGELLDRIQKQHGVPVRVDLAHVLPMTAMTAMTTARKTPKYPGNSAVKSPSALGLLPFGVSPSYSSEPSPPVYYPPRSLNGTPALPSLLPPVTFAPEGTPNLPPPELPSTPLQAYKLTAISEEDDADEEAPVSAIKAEVIDALDPGPPPVVQDASGDEASPNEAANEIQEMLTQMLSAPVNPAIINQPEATVEDVLRQAFDRSFPLQALINASIGEAVPMLASFTKATEWDLLLQDDGILLTTRLNANLHKETRVYSTRELEKTAGLKAEDVARVLTRTVRPWSWKKNFPDTTAILKPATDTKRAAKSGGKISIPKIDLSMLSMFLSAKSPLPQHIRLASDDGTVTVEATPGSSSENVELTEEQLELLGRAWDGLFQGAVSSIQMIYHADPPTGVIEVLPGMLVVSQSQGAHREIADLLEQLSQPEN